jgi:hypothetical protein
MATWDAQIVHTFDGREAIFCRCCGSLSWHPMDVKMLYCGRCHASVGEHANCKRGERERAGGGRTHSSS